MKAMMKFSSVAAATLAAIGVVGCDSIRTVEEEPAFATPPQKVVLSGTVTGASESRPLQLNVQLTDNGVNSGTNTITVLGTDKLRLGAVDIGGSYNVTVAQNPFGRSCSVANGTGVATAPVDNVTVTCVRDPAVPLYTATLNIAPALANALPPNFRVSLRTEDGVETIAPTPGQTSVVFTNPILASGSNLPTFTYLMTATTESDGVVGNCAVTGATNVAGENTLAPVGSVVGTVTACSFTIGGTVGYSQPPNVPYASRTITGLQLALRENASQEDVETINVTPFTPASPGTATTPFAFASRLSTDSALYEVVVTAQPAGMHCIVDNGGLASLMVRPSTTSSGITSPATQPANVSNVGVRCRDLPAAANTLVGTYQVVGMDSTITTVSGPNTTVVNTKHGTADPDGLGTTTTTTVNAGTPTVTAATPSFDRRFLTFFENGTFLYGVHGSTTVSTFFGRSLNTCTSCGVEYGFYAYDDVTRTIYFTIRTDTNNGIVPPFTFPPSNSLVAGLSGMPGLFNGVPAMADVVKTAGARGSLTGVFGPAASTATTNRSAWTLLEPVQTAGELEGAWATADNRRVFVYTKAGQRPAFHVGINGAPTMQDACLGILDPTVPSGFWTPRDRSTGCSPGSYLDPADTTPPIGLTGGYTPIDIPEAAGLPGSTLMGSNQAIFPGYNGRMPGMQSNDSVTRSPSPVEFTVTGGATDTLTVQDTFNGVPVGDPIVMQRIRPN